MLGATLLRVNLSTGQIRKEMVPETIVRNFVGGRGVGSKLLMDNLDPKVDALDPRNPLIFATGPVTGTYAPTGGRYMVVTKSPLTGAIASSNSGGYWGPALRFAGYDYLMIEGAAKEPVYLYIHDDKVEVRDARHLWGKIVDDTENIIRETTHPEVRVASIGPAGENLARTACVMNDKGRAAGRSGVGAVMGAKKLKAVAVLGTKGLKIANADAFTRAVLRGRDKLVKGPTTQGLNMLGTAGTVSFMNQLGMLPTNNFQMGVFAHAAAVDGPVVKKEYMTRNRGCHSCMIHCGRVTKVTGHGRFDGKGEGPEYETIFGVGTDCGVGDLAAVIKANYLCNELGMDTLEAGIAIATAMELAEKGYIPESDVGFTLKFGDPNALVELLEAQAHRKGVIGHWLAEGGYRLAEHYGHPELFMGSKKQGFAAYDPRGSVGMGLAYATSNRGACHLRGYTVSVEHFGNPVKLDPFATQDKAYWLTILQNTTSFVDASGICLFSTFDMSPGEDVTEMVNEVFGERVAGSPEEMLKIGERIWNLERLFNNAAGFTRADDSLPPRITSEPLTEGMSKGHVVDLEPMLNEYYQLRGWDREGRPTPEKLRELGLA
ncbi:MAG: aldehyde ferredoxin oxidoreductase family protein [Thermodesulfobacteriota bacterium]|jgi:aldehyde:ferredoxin oxidoreductase